MLEKLDSEKDLENHSKPVKYFPITVRNLTFPAHTPSFALNADWDFERRGFPVG
jgi:hypothetical protein